MNGFTSQVRISRQKLSPRVRNFQRDLYQAMKQDAATANIPVLSASLPNQKVFCSQKRLIAI